MCVCVCVCVLFFYLLCSEFSKTIPRPFAIRYNPYTQSVEVINSSDALLSVSCEIKSELSILEDGLKKCSTTTATADSSGAGSGSSSGGGT